LPFLNNGTDVLARFAGGWQVSGVFTLRSGQAVTPRLTQDRSQTFLLADRPDIVGDWKAAKPDPTQWWNKSAFALPPALSFGHAGTGVLTGPGLKQMDLSLSKNFRLNEIRRFEFRAEFFNFTNHPNF